MILSSEQMVIQGFLDRDDSFDLLTCDGYYLIKDISSKFPVGEQIMVQYYITTQKLSLEQTKEALILKMVGGNVDQLEFILDAYSEYTIEELKEDFVVGGHDLVTELQNYIGKYLTLIIEKK